MIRKIVLLGSVFSVSVLSALHIPIFKYIPGQQRVEWIGVDTEDVWPGISREELTEMFGDRLDEKQIEELLEWVNEADPIWFK